MKTLPPRRGRALQTLVVSPMARSSAAERFLIRGHMIAGGLIIPCVLGRSGIGGVKREGDGRTPRGQFRILGGFFRPDLLRRPRSLTSLKPLSRSDGWCDTSEHPAYNRPVRLPFAAGHERLWRDDALYDIGLILDYNLTQRIRRRGSAIFFHIWRDSRTPTEGCIAISSAWMKRLLPRLARNSVVKIR